MDFLQIVLIIGFILIAVVLVVALVSVVSHANGLAEARAKLENALTAAYATFEAFVSNLAVSVSRFVDKMREMFLAYVRVMSTAFNGTLRFATDFLTNILGWADHTFFRFVDEFGRLESKVREVIFDTTTMMYGKMITIPVDVGTTIVLNFTALITGAIHSIFCYVFNGFSKLGALVNNALGGLESWFVNTIQAPLLGILNPIRDWVLAFPTNFVNLLNANVLNPIENFFTSTFAPFISSFNGIQSAVNSICSVNIPVVGHLC